MGKRGEEDILLRQDGLHFDSQMRDKWCHQHYRGFSNPHNAFHLCAMRTKTRISLLFCLPHFLYLLSYIKKSSHPYFPTMFTQRTLHLQINKSILNIVILCTEQLHTLSTFEQLKCRSLLIITGHSTVLSFSFYLYTACLTQRYMNQGAEDCLRSW